MNEEASALTFDLSGWPKASPLEGMVRRLLDHGLLCLEFRDFRGRTPGLASDLEQRDEGADRRLGV